MSNHISYLDIVVLGSLLPASFLAKSEVASWPVFGFLSKLRQTAFINRKRTAIMAAKKSLDQRIAQGRSLIIFPEGTSTDGRSVYPFKSSLFALALGRHNDDLLVQPVTIRVDSSDGVAPKTQEERDIYAWHLHMDCSLAVHLWRFAKAGGAELSVIFHEPLRAATFEDRKTLANTCHDSVNSGLNC